MGNAATIATNRALNAALWVAQVLLGLSFALGGLWKLFTPVAQLGAVMPWMGQVPQALVRGTALIDLAGGLGVLLPSVTRIRPRLTVLAALGCAALMVCAIGFHFSRGEAANTPANFVFLVLALFIAWGRRYKAPIESRE